MDIKKVQKNIPTETEIKETKVEKAPKKDRSLFFGIIFFLIIIFAACVWAADKYNKKAPVADLIKEVPKKVVEKVIKPAVVSAFRFATYNEEEVDVSPQVPAYPEVAVDLSNIDNKSLFEFTKSQIAKLVKNYFVVIPSDRLSFRDEFFPIYENNRYNKIANFVTTDSILHNYHLLFDYTLRRLEEEKLATELKSLNSLMFTQSEEQFNQLKGGAWENAAARNLAFFTVGSKLSDASSTVPEIIRANVEAELDLISAHNDIKESPVMNIGAEKSQAISTPQGDLELDAIKEDYTQYIPRGHYDKTETLKAYFKNMMWYGRITFRMKNEDEIKSAVLITMALNQGNNAKSWDTLFEPINFFVGKSDDITYYQFKELFSKIYGENFDINEVISNKEKWSKLLAEIDKLEPPQINSMPIFNASLQADRDKEIKGFRFMGQRFTVDASVFQRLVTREVGPKGADCSKAPFTTGRMLPKSLDIPAAMGSAEAEKLLKEQGDYELACYSDNMTKLKTHINGLDKGVWTQNLYWGWLYSLLPLITEKTTGYPAFMQNLAWTRKELNTYLGSWTELKHDTILYAKQVYAELGGSGDIPNVDDRGYVEPNYKLYSRLASLLAMTKDGLEARGLLSVKNKDNLDKMEKLASSLKTISIKELKNEKLTDEEYELIRSYGGQLEHIWLEVNKEEMEAKGMDQNNFLNQNPAALITDVATDPNGQVLEEGTGPVQIIYVVVMVDGKMKIAKGGVYSHYEFAWPINDRLTDQKWRELLNSEQAPKMTAWTSEYMSN